MDIDLGLFNAELTVGRFYVFVCVCVRKGSLHERNIFMTTTMTWHFFVSSFGGFGMSTYSNQELG